ncbi:hypothetical protein [Rugamonas sp. DEMB1]|uniref:hypothetical protein n=1 Tax=Rugamonas sp. DEMB1 TaxID=3039386 RepID=UPI002446C090|nr:hypothetical protein [Rugamonas sp. DEMB1]WGG52159.1 hypothetical protein QC826_08275 [Rugamonas sp. DEMB1]
MSKIVIFVTTAAVFLSACGRSTPDTKALPTGQAAAVQKCQYALVRSGVFDWQEGRIEVSDYTVSDTPDQSWVNASFTLQDSKNRLTETEVKSVLKRLVDRIIDSCRSNPIQKSRIFLSPAGVTAGESANWIARYDSASNPETTIHHNLLKDERKDKYLCIDKVEPGRSLDVDPKLPPVRQRKIIGTWAQSTFNLTLSLEQVGAKVYSVRRNAYCKSGDRGEMLKTGPGKRYSVIGSGTGNYYEVLPSGDLGVFDRDGRVDTLPIHFALHSASTGNKE